MSQLKYITFYTVTGGEQTLALQDYSRTVQVDVWSDSDTALSGRKRQNLRGFREVFRIDYQACVEPGAYRELFGNIVADLLAGHVAITISEGPSLSGAQLVVPTDRLRHAVEYNSQIGEFVPSLEFITAQSNRIGQTRYVDEGYVSQGYVE